MEGGVSTFPTVGLQLPYTAKLASVTCKVEGAAGQEYVWYHDANPVRRWELSWPVLTSAELTTLRDFFDDMGGGWDSFSFTDPDSSTTYTKCRFDGDFELTYNADGTYSLKLSIQEFR